MVYDPCPLPLQRIALTPCRLQSPVRPSPARSTRLPPPCTLHTPTLGPAGTHNLPSPIAGLDRRTIDAKFQAMMAGYTAGQSTKTMTSTPKMAPNPTNPTPQAAAPPTQPSLHASLPVDDASFAATGTNTSASASLDLPSDLSQQLRQLELSNARHRQKVRCMLACRPWQRTHQ